jgi:superfamily II DNA helicase RecQ
VRWTLIKSRNESYHRWKNGEINVMVATSAFGMGIDKSDIKHIVRLGVPENMCSWAQELGRAGRGGDNATATIFYSTSDIDHAGTWIRDHVHNFDYCNSILKEFGNAWKYVTSHLSGECRRKIFLNQFGEGKEVNNDDNTCCDVCSNQHSISRIDRKEELSIAIDAIDTIGTKGEVKIVQWIRGSTLQWTSNYDKAASSYGNSMGHSELWWRRFLRQSAASGALERELKSLIK